MPKTGHTRVTCGAVNSITVIITVTHTVTAWLQRGVSQVCKRIEEVHFDQSIDLTFTDHLSSMTWLYNAKTMDTFSQTKVFGCSTQWDNCGPIDDNCAIGHFDGRQIIFYCNTYLLATIEHFRVIKKSFYL